MDTSSDESECEDVVQVFDVKNLPSLISNTSTLSDEISHYDMTSLGAYMLLGQATATTSRSNELEDDDDNLQRVSLAYERIRVMPNILIQELGPYTKILDISNNEFYNLDFLRQFRELTTLICDRNNITSDTLFPYLPKLELLWLNHCEINEIYPWAKRLRNSCPNLKYLSLMGNLVAPSYLNGGTFYEYLQYRYFMISLFPRLIHLDDRAVTENERREADKTYHRPLMERLMCRTQNNLPGYLKIMTEKVSEMLAPTPLVQRPQKNLII